MQDIVSYLPAVVWYLTQNGRDMWCRKPYGFFFSSEEAATAFVGRMKTEFELVPIGISSTEIVSPGGLEAFRGLQVTRIFLDPSVDEATGEVFGTILRLESVN